MSARTRPVRMAERPAVRWLIRFTDRLYTHQVGEQASVIAFNAIYAMFPLVLSLTAIGGFIVRSPIVRMMLLEQVEAVFPEQIAKEMSDVINTAGAYPGLIGLIGFVSLLWAGSNLFAAIEVSFSRIFGVPSRGIVQQRIAAIVMILLFSALLVLSVVASDAVVFFGTGARPGRILSLIGGWLVAMLLQLVTYAVIPNVKLPFRALWPGAVLAGTAFQVTGLVFPIYLRYFAGFNRFGDVFSLVFLMMTWFYFLSFILLVGAGVNALRYTPPAGASRSAAEPPTP